MARLTMGMLTCLLLFAACSAADEEAGTDQPTDPEQAQAVAEEYVAAVFAFDREAVDALPWADVAREVDGAQIDPGLHALTRYENQDAALEDYSCAQASEDTVAQAAEFTGIDVDVVVQCEVAYSNRVSRLLRYEATDVVVVAYSRGEVVDTAPLLGSTPVLDEYLAYTERNSPAIFDPQGPCVTGPEGAETFLDPRYPYPAECAELWWESAQEYAAQDGAGGGQ